MSSQFPQTKAILIAIIIFSVTIIVVASQSYQYVFNIFSDKGKVSTQRTSLQEFLTDDLVAISELKNPGTKAGRYTTEGYIAHISICPECPKNSQCKPCASDNIIISEREKIITDYVLTNKEIIAQVEKSSDFTLEKKYRFIVELKDSENFIENQRDIEVIKYLEDN
jgi:DNA-binding transcriptional regulator of glucitol operon